MPPLFPQLATGALCHFPIRKLRTLRSVTNATADGRSIRLADPAGGTTIWRLEYVELTDDEAAALGQFFAQAEGSLNGFTFVDPTANLLSRSANLGDAMWAREPMLAAASGMEDPAGGTNAWRLSNSGSAAQSISQTPAAPGDYTYCLSAYARAATAGAITATVGARSAERRVSASWKRITFTATGDSGAAATRFGIEIPAGSTVDLYGIQAEAQAGASAYRNTETGGVFDGARFLNDSLEIVTTGVNRHSCSLYITHADHL